MNKRLWRMWSSICLVLVLALSAGCQAIGGVDLNKALLGSMLEVNSMEGSSSVTIEFTLDDQAAADSFGEQELAMLKAINPLKLNFDKVKMENRETMSVSGSLEITRGKIPFALSLTKDELVFKPEGAAKPFVLKLNELQSGSGAMSPEQKKIMLELQTKFQDTAFLKPIYSYFISDMPNPKNIAVSNVNETINGESVSLHKVEASMTGTELLPWLKSYLVKLMQDDQGLKVVIAHLYDTLKPIIDSAVKAQKQDSIIPSSPDAEMGDMGGMSGMFGPYGEMLSNMMGDRDTAIEVLHTEAKQIMVIGLAMLNLPEFGGSGLADILNDKSYAKTNIYIDNSLEIRKSESEVLLTVPESMAYSGVKTVKITTSSSNWNVNKEVKADIIPSADAFELGAGANPAGILGQLDSGSVLYQFLKQDLHVTRKMVKFWPESFKWYPPSMLTYSENGTTMVPARHMAEQLGASIDWNAANQSVTITDKRTGAVIVAIVDSTTATVNGKEVQLEVPAAIKNGVLYVPLRFVAEALDGQVEWDAHSGIITVTVE